jgi:hypothetical protein
MNIDIPAWHAHEYAAAVRVLRALLKGEDGTASVAISGIKAGIAANHPNWNKHLLEHTESVLNRLESV